MEKLSRAGFEKARAFIFEQGRLIDQTVFDYHFAGGPLSDILAALAAYQNQDGGFGHALEPDHRSPLSHVLATTTATDLLRELDAPGDHPLVQATLAYLVRAYDTQTRVWRMLPPQAAAYPHAPWWNDEGDSLAKTFRQFRVNPRARVLAALYHYRQDAAIPAGWLDEVTESLAVDAETTELTWMDLEFLLDLLDEPAFPENYRGRLLPLTLKLSSEQVSRDPAEWAEYSAQPLELVHSPRSLLYATLREPVEANLDWRIRRQGEDGSWSPNWSWFGQYEDVWPQARQEWSGNITLRNLLAFKAFGRLEN